MLIRACDCYAIYCRHNPAPKRHPLGVRLYQLRFIAPPFDGGLGFLTGLNAWVYADFFGCCISILGFGIIIEFERRPKL